MFQECNANMFQSVQRWNAFAIFSARSEMCAICKKWNTRYEIYNVWQIICETRKIYSSVCASFDFSYLFHTPKWRFFFSCRKFPVTSMRVIFKIQWIRFPYHISNECAVSRNVTYQSNYLYAFWEHEKIWQGLFMIFFLANERIFVESIRLKCNIESNSVINLCTRVKSKSARVH